MAYTIRTEDGIEIPNIPDDVPPDSPELVARVQMMRAQRSGQGLMRQFGMPTVQQAVGQADFSVPQAPQQSASEPETTAAGLAGAAARGALPTAGGALGGAIVGGLVGLPGGVPGVAAGATTGAKVGAGLVGATDLVISLANFATGKDYTSPTLAVEDLLTKIGVPEPKSKAEKFLQAITAGAAGGAGGAAGAAGAAKMLPAGGKLSQAAAGMATGPGMQTVMGATGGIGGEIAGQAAQEGGASPGTEVAARLAGSMLGSGVPSGVSRVAGVTKTPAAQSPVRIRQQAEIAASEAAGISPATSQVVKPSTFMGEWVTSTAQQTLGGTGKQFARIKQQRTEAVGKLLDDMGYGDVDALSVAVAEEAIKNRKATVGSLKQARTEALEKAKASGNPVDVSMTRKAVIDKIAELEETSIGEDATIAALREFDRKLSEKMAKSPDDVLAVDALRRSLGEKLVKQGEVSSSDAKKAKDSIYAAVRDDITSYVQQNASQADADRFKSVNSTLASMSLEKENLVQIRNLFNKGEFQPDAALKALTSMNPNVREVLFNTLSDQGRANARALLVTTIAKSARGDAPDFSKMNKTKFLTMLKSESKKAGIPFTDQQIKAIDKLETALRLTDSAESAAVVPKTGVTIKPYAQLGAVGGLGALFGGPVGAVVASGSALGAAVFARLLESKEVRDAIARMPEVQLGSREHFEFVKRFTQAARASLLQEQEQQQASAQ